MRRPCLLGDAITLKRGYDLPHQMRQEGDIPIVSSAGITGTHAECKVRGPGVVTGRYGTLGEIHYVASDFWPLNTTLYVQDFKGNDPRFVSYLLQTLDFGSRSGAAAVPGVNRNDLHRLPVVLPDVEEQRRIASILSAYDDLIENNTRRIAILEEMARRIYEEWFVRFRFPGHEQVKMVESELGLIPDGWFPSPVGECVTVHRGKSYKSAELADEGGLPFVNLKCMERDGGFRKSGLKRFTGSYKETQKVTTGDLVMAVTDMTQERRIVARCGRVPRLGADFGVISMDLVKLDANKGVPKDFIYGMFRWSGFADEVKQHANGANVLHLSPDRIAEYRFALPPSDVAAQFAGLISPMLHQSDVLLEKNANLRATRDLLLPKLISGELDVSTLSEPVREMEAAA